MYNDNPSDDDVQETVIKNVADQIFRNDDHLLFGSSETVDISTLHPEPVQMFRLWQIYLENVDPLLKVTHTPSLQGQIIEAASSISNIRPELEALMFSIYCMSITSIAERDCQAMFGSSKSNLLANYQFGCQQALLNCGFLRTSERDCLTALYLYLVSVRSGTVPQSLSSMLGVAIRIAQRMGMHSETLLATESVLEAELRRRLWWSLVLFDARICEMSNSKTSMLDPTWNCKIPLNLNDSDLSPELKEPPQVQGSSSQALFSMLRCEIGEVVRHSTFYLDLTNPALKFLARDGEYISYPDGGGLSNLEATFEAKYLKFCDQGTPIHFMTQPASNQAEHIWELLSDNYDAHFSPAESDDSMFIKIVANLLLRAWEVREAEYNQLGGTLTPPRIVVSVRRRLIETTKDPRSLHGEFEKSATNIDSNVYSGHSQLVFPNQVIFNGRSELDAFQFAVAGSYQNTSASTLFDFDPNLTDFSATDWATMNLPSQVSLSLIPPLVRPAIRSQDMSQPARIFRRSLIACEPCRNRKRKCNSKQPCTTCKESEIRCYYNADTRKKRNKKQVLERMAAGDQQTIESKPHAPDESPAENSPEANSSAAFARTLALKLDPVRAPKPQLFGWNIGEREREEPDVQSTGSTIREFTSKEELEKLARIYFEKVDPYYGFVDREVFTHRCQARWQEPVNDTESYDATLFGVAAMGLLFSTTKLSTSEVLFVEARAVLEKYTTPGQVSMDMITGWTLRLAYLRLTGTPHDAWMTSCNVLHLMNIARLHLEHPSSSILVQNTPRDERTVTPEIRIRLLGYVQYIHTWISYDLGLSRIVLHGSKYSPPSSARKNDHTAEMLSLLPLSELLDPREAVDPERLIKELSNIFSNIDAPPPSILSQCNLALCIHRRLLALGRLLSNELITNLLAFTTRALACARELSHSMNPWSHVASIPFQILCTLLAIDTPSSQAQLTDAMHTLQERKKKEEEVYNLNVLVQNHCSEVDAGADGEGGAGEGMLEIDEMMVEVPGLEDFDFTQFFMSELGEMGGDAS
ncbi:c6 transcription factor protein [Rutstroemia sp. NJR-2017a BBW]|nr:c6 transcription factor protein [Rutstroemia sp. NJR-2017a BBW]